MPIRFRCEYCGQLLGIARRKSGSSVPCPRCHNFVLVPPEDRLDKPKPSSSARMFESNEFDKWLGKEEDRPKRAISDSSPVIKALDIADFPEAEDSQGESWPQSEPAARRLPREEEEISRVPGLIVACLLVGFGLGLVVGRYLFPHVTSPSNTPAVAPAAPKNIPEPAKEAAPAVTPGADRLPTVVGIMRYRNADREDHDAGASVIVFPQNEKLQTKIQSEGLRPEHRSQQHKPGVDVVRSYGGEIGYTKDDGSFSISVNRPGKYWVLVISNRMKRGEGQGIFAGDRPVLSQYFADVDGLLEGREYLLVSRQVPEGVSQSVQHCFVETP